MAMHWDDFSVFDHLKHFIFVLVPDEDGLPVYQFLNRSGRARLDKGRDDIVGRPAHEVFSGRAAQSVYRRQCEVWADAVEAEYDIALPIGGDTIWCRTNIVPVFDAAGRLTHMIGTTRDITPERTALHAQVLGSAAAQDLEDLICMAAHDLRSPLSTLKTLAGMMRKDFVDHGDGKTALIDMIDSVSDRALSVVSDIMGQAMALGPDREFADFDLGGMCDDVMVMLDPTSAHSVSYPRLGVQAEYTVVHIILCNLIDNALRHSGRTVAEISIDLTPMNAERLLFTVRDNGVGFGGKTLAGQGRSNDAAFGKFGLLGVKRLVRSRGGRLILGTPASGRGAEVQVELPGRIPDRQIRSEPALRAS